MLATLAVPYADTKAEQLVWTLDHPPVLALADTVVAVDDRADLELRVLGASHQVVLTRHDVAGEKIVETVACLAGERPYLPRAVGRDGDRYRFRADVENMADRELRSRVHRIREAASADCALLAEFPGRSGAVTAIRAHTSLATIAWETWHVYPNYGQIVTTNTEVLG